MNKYIVRQAIKDIKRNIIGYELLFQNEMYSDEKNADVDAIVSFLEQNSKSIFEDKIAFITFGANLFFKNIPKIFDENKVVIQIDDNVLVHPMAYEMLQGYKDLKYMIAVNDFQFSPRHFGILGVVDYIRLDFSDLDEARDSYENVIKTAKGFQKKCIAFAVDTKEAYDFAVQLSVDYFEGTYLDERVFDQVNRMDFLQSNFFRLVVEISKEEPNLAEIESIISRDVTLTYMLLKLVNSAYFSLRNKATSIMQALVILGLSRLKQWVYLLSFKQGEANLREDLIKTSFLRANFCSELLRYTQTVQISNSEAYLMGMFSTLGAMTNMKLEDVLAEVDILDEIKEALLHETGACGMLYKLVLSYEKADWKKINEYAEQLRIPKDVISQIYFNCMDSVNTTWKALTTSYGDE